MAHISATFRLTLSSENNHNLKYSREGRHGWNALYGQENELWYGRDCDHYSRGGRSRLLGDTP